MSSNGPLSSNENDIGGLTPAAGYGKFQDSIYAAGFLRNERPIVTTDPTQLEAQARAVLDDASFVYVAGGAGAKQTMAANRAAFQQWRLIPRMLQPVSQRDLRINLFGQQYGAIPTS